MLIMKQQCQRCRAPLGPQSDSYICSLECTFCADCAGVLNATCPNCSGELVPRPRRDPSRKIAAGLGSRLRVAAQNLTAARQTPNVSVERVIDASAREIFDILAAPARHAEIDGSGTITGAPVGPTRLHPGAKFSMGMNPGLRYRSTNEVVAYEDNKIIAWQTFGEVRGRRLIGGQVWRYDLTPSPDGKATRVRATFDWSQARAGRFTIEAAGLPAKTRESLSATLSRLEAVVAAAR